ncbi:MAG: nrdR [Micavibrio sp.]|nr:nrdR [Micavibrio sp.]
MRCPFCNNEDSQVKDSRPSEDGASIRRRRFCAECGGRFTTFERVQLREMVVIKNDERRQVFDREKVNRSMQIALRKRPVDAEHIEKSVNAIVRQLESMGESEIPSSQIGELVMRALARLDQIGYIRYASVYKDFRKPEDFNEFLDEIKDIQPNKPVAAE